MQLAFGPELLQKALRSDVAIDDDRKTGAERIPFAERLSESGKL
jgi:hypothetical protein